jgi:hypothetical protein
MHLQFSDISARLFLFSTGALAMSRGGIPSSVWQADTDPPPGL